MVPCIGQDIESDRFIEIRIICKVYRQPEQTYDCVFVKAAIKISTAEPSPLLNIVIISAECKSEQEEEAKKTFSELDNQSSTVSWGKDEQVWANQGLITCYWEDL